MALLEELRLWGEHETLQARIEHYLSAATVPELYQKILERYEQDYERDRPGLVRDAMTLLWAARRGLSEAELMDLLGKGGETGRWWTASYWMGRLSKRGRERQPLPRAYWSPLYLAAEPSLVSRSGLIGFSHDYLREAVQQAYLPTSGHRERVHRTLARYFSSQPQGPRQLDELPWQWQEAAEWQSLADLLSQPGVFDALWEKNQFEVKAYWTRIEADSPWRITEAYRRAIEQPAQYPLEHVWKVGMLLADTGQAEALAARTYLVEHYREVGDAAMLASALGNLAELLHTRKDFDGAMALLKEQERFCRSIGDNDGLLRALGNQASILGARKNLDGAMALNKEVEHLCRELGNKEGLLATLNNQAVIFQARGDLDRATALLIEAERLSRELGNKDGLQALLNSKANILYARGDLDRALAFSKEAERLCRELGNKDGLLATLATQATIFRFRGDLDAAMAPLKEAERLCRELGVKDQLSGFLGALATILHTRRDLDGAIALYDETARLCRELGNKELLGSALEGQASILYARGDLDGAMALYKEQERLCRELGNKEGLSISLGNQAGVQYGRGDLELAMVLRKEQERLCRELGNKEGLSISLDNQANTRQARGDLDGAMSLHKEVERLCRELGNKEGLSISLANQASLLSKRQGRRREARRLADEALAIATRHGYQRLLPQFQRIRDSIPADAA